MYRFFSCLSTLLLLSAGIAASGANAATFTFSQTFEYGPENISGWRPVFEGFPLNDKAVTPFNELGIQGQLQEVRIFAVDNGSSIRNFQFRINNDFISNGDRSRALLVPTVSPGFNISLFGTGLDERLTTALAQERTFTEQEVEDNRNIFDRPPAEGDPNNQTGNDISDLIGLPGGTVSEFDTFLQEFDPDATDSELLAADNLVQEPFVLTPGEDFFPLFRDSRDPNNPFFLTAVPDALAVFDITLLDGNGNSVGQILDNSEFGAIQDFQGTAQLTLDVTYVYTADTNGTTPLPIPGSLGLLGLGLLGLLGRLSGRHPRA